MAPGGGGERAGGCGPEGPPPCRRLSCCAFRVLLGDTSCNDGRRHRQQGCRVGWQLGRRGRLRNLEHRCNSVEMSYGSKGTFRGRHRHCGTALHAAMAISCCCSCCHPPKQPPAFSATGDRHRQHNRSRLRQQRRGLGFGRLQATRPDGEAHAQSWVTSRCPPTVCLPPVLPPPVAAPAPHVHLSALAARFGCYRGSRRRASRASALRPPPRGCTRPLRRACACNFRRGVNPHGGIPHGDSRWRAGGRPASLPCVLWRRGAPPTRTTALGSLPTQAIS